MKFNSESAKKAGKISKRGRALPMEMRSSLYELVNTILNDLDYESLNVSQKIKLLDVALKYSLPKLSIEKPIEEPEPPQEIQITIIDSNGEKRTRKSVLDENFKVKNLVGGDSSKHKETS